MFQHFKLIFAFLLELQFLFFKVVVYYSLAVIPQYSFTLYAGRYCGYCEYNRWMFT